MMKRVLIVMGLLGMGIAAGFAVFVASSADNSLKAVDDPWCLWPYSSGTLTLEYRWTSTIGSSSPWRAAFEHAVDAWNDEDTNVEWEHNAYGKTSLSAYSLDDHLRGYTQVICSGGSNPIRTHNLIWVNNFFSSTTNDRRYIATHEMGHGLGLWHNTDDDNNDVMDIPCCGVTMPSSDDVEAVNDIF